MSNQFSGFGNLGTAPTLRSVNANGAALPVADMRIYFDRRVPKGDRFADEGGFWLSVSLWGPRAESAAQALRKGARVYVAGSLRQEAWTKDGAEREAMRLTADFIAIDPGCVESVLYRTRNAKPEPESAELSDDDIPF
jgi:single-strand DNA-binding protein